MKLLVATFVFFSIFIAVVCSMGYSFIKAFCRPYPKKESSIWSDALGANYEHEREVNKKCTGSFNILIPTFYYEFL